MCKRLNVGFRLGESAKCPSWKTDRSSVAQPAPQSSLSIRPPNHLRRHSQNTIISVERACPYLEFTLVSWRTFHYISKAKLHYFEGGISTGTEEGSVASARALRRNHSTIYPVRGPRLRRRMRY